VEPPPPDDDAQPGRGISVPAAEIATAAVLLLLAALVLYDSVRLGMRWADDGPQAGYFPFYVGMALAVASLIVLGRALRQAWRPAAGTAPFVTWERLRPVGAMLGPLAVYFIAMRWLGLYLASFLFIGYCMRRMGGYGWRATVVLPAAVTLALFLLFELWFKIPLVKGPLEAALGLG
jgi:putative tricarboxylic transport membrane protein